MKTRLFLKPILALCLAAATTFGLPLARTALAAGQAPTPTVGVWNDENGKKHLSVTVGGTEAVAINGRLVPSPSGENADPEKQSNMMQAIAFARGLCRGEQRRGKTSDAWRQVPSEQQKELFAAYCTAVDNQIGKPISTSDRPALVFLVLEKR